MKNRWCIISGARSGSTWLEEMIYNAFPKADYSIKLGEILELSNEHSISAGHKWGIKINQRGYLEINKDTTTVINDKDAYIDYIINCFHNGNGNQNIVLKIFPQEWKYTKEQYLKVINTLQECGFQFIHLDRAVISRALSWYYMTATNIIHRYIEGDRIFFSSTAGITYDKGPDRIEIDLEKWNDFYKLCFKEDQLITDILSSVNHVKLKYETLIEDCNRNKIAINTNTNVRKTYLLDYENKIVNWKEFLDYTISREFIKKQKFINGLNDNDNIVNTICQFAWDYPVLQVSRNEFRHCCRAKSYKLLPSDLENGSNLFKEFKPMLDIRRNLLNGIKDEACNSCWAIEKTGTRSPRTGLGNFVKFLKQNLWKNQTYSQIQHRLLNLSDNDMDMILKLDSPRMVEISLGNLCDLKCMYCHEHYSSQWASEKIKYGELTKDQAEKELPRLDETAYETAWWDWFENSAVDTLVAINFIGGEPLIIERFYLYMDRILSFYEKTPYNKKNIDISVVTNLNTPPKQFDRFLEIVKRIIYTEHIKLDFNISMESIRERAEFIRTGSDWDLMMKNLEKFIAFVNEHDTFFPSKVIINLQIAINSLCVTDLPNFFKFVIDLQRNNMRPINLRQNQVVFPQWMSTHILPISYTKYLDEAIELLETEVVDNDKYSLFGRWDSYINFLKNVRTGIAQSEKDNRVRREFAANIDKLTARRGLDFHKTFPSMEEFYEDCKKL